MKQIVSPDFNHSVNVTNYYFTYVKKTIFAVYLCVYLVICDQAFFFLSFICLVTRL